MVFSLPPRGRAPGDSAKLDELTRSGAVRRGAAGLTLRPERVVRTGIPAFDRLLPGGGLPAGHITELAGSPSSGKLSVAVRALVATLAEGERAAFVDTSYTFFPGTPELTRALGRLLVCRVPSTLDGIGAAELLASGGFGLVVVDLAPLAGLDSAARSALARLARAAREGQAAVVAVTEPPAGAEALLGSIASLRVGVTAAARRVRDGGIDALVEVARSRFPRASAEEPPHAGARG